MHVGSRDYLEPQVEGILDQINDAVRQVESKENTRDRDCSMRQTVKEIQAGKFHQITSPFLLVMQTARQRELLVKYGNTVMLMDAIYKTCKYNFPCFFLTVKPPSALVRLLPLSFLSLKPKRCFHKVFRFWKVGPLHGTLPSSLLTRVQLSLMLLPRYTQKLWDYCVTSIEHKHKIAGSTRTVMEFQLNSRQLCQLNSRHWHMHQQVWGYVSLLTMCMCDVTCT